MASSIDLGVVRHHIGENGNWWIGDTDTGATAIGAEGKAATIKIGAVTTGPEAAVVNTGTDSDVVLSFTIPRGENGKDGADGAPGADGKDGKDGADGAPGADGKDGVDGAPGADGKDGVDGAPGADGKDGADGAPGASAYEIAVENGFEGTESEWLQSISAANITAYTAWENWRDLDPDNNTLTYDEWISERLQSSLPSEPSTEPEPSPAEGSFSEDEIQRIKAQLVWEASGFDVECWTGKYHVDGKKIYGKRMYLGTLPNGNKTIPHNTLNIDSIVWYTGIYNSSGYYQLFPGRITSSSNWLWNPYLNVTKDNVSIATNDNLTSLNAPCHMYFEYTCTDR